MNKRALGAGLWLGAVSLLQVGCLETKKVGATCVTDKVDLLFMVDNSNSMQQEQESLAMNFPRMVQVLITGDRDLNPATTDDTFQAVKDLHLGVVTSDMGTAGATVQTCNAQPRGEDAVLRTIAGAGATGLTCATTYPSFLSFRPGVDGNDRASGQTPEAFANDFACIARVGTDGCGFEQQLEASLKALTPASSPLRFQDDTTGQGAGGANDGFLRDDSVVAVVVVTDEEDCSFADASLVDGSDTDVTQVSFNLRCATFPELLHPVERYVDGFKALRPNRESLVVFAAITGIPTDLVPSGSEQPDYDAILDDLRLVQMPDPENPNQLRPSCNDTGRGKADPPRRILEVARGLGSNATVQSICQESYIAALDAVVGKIAKASCGSP